MRIAVVRTILCHGVVKIDLPSSAEIVSVHMDPHLPGHAVISALIEEDDFITEGREISCAAIYGIGIADTPLKENHQARYIGSVTAGGSAYFFFELRPLEYESESDGVNPIVEEGASISAHQKMTAEGGKRKR